jgi:Icc-related predicted phosphoesterase
METRDNLKRHWDLIPKDTDVVITHQPPFMIGDLSNYKQQHTGCEYLNDILINKIKPKVHICGHIHEGYGQQEIKGIRFCNVSVLDENYELKHKPTTIII